MADQEVILASNSIISMYLFNTFTFSSAFVCLFVSFSHVLFIFYGDGISG